MFLGLQAIWSLSQPPISALLGLSSHRYSVNEWAWLCANKTLFMYLETWISCNSMCHQIFFFIWLLFYYWNIKTMPSLWAVPSFFSLMPSHPSLSPRRFSLLTSLPFSEHVKFFATVFLFLGWSSIFYEFRKSLLKGSHLREAHPGPLSCLSQHFSYNLLLFAIYVYASKHGSHCIEIICAFFFPLTFCFMKTKALIYLFPSLEVCEMPRIW